MSIDDELQPPLAFTGVRVMVALLAGICAVHLVFALMSYSSLPEKIPMHFNAAGVPDAFASRGVGSWFLLWFVSAGMGLLFTAFSLTLHTMPERYLSLPRKQAFLALPAAAKSRVWAVAAFHILVFIAIFMLVFFVAHVSTALVARGALDRLPVWWLLPGLVASIVQTVVLTVRLLDVVNREIDEHERSGTRR